VVLHSVYSVAIERQGRSLLVISSALKSAEASVAILSEFLTPDRRQVASIRLPLYLYLWLLLADWVCACVCPLLVAVSMKACGFHELAAFAG
jgi:hypothetical protein